MFVLGAHLKSKKYACQSSAKDGLTRPRGSKPPMWPLIYLFTYRFAIMPLISTSVIFGVRRGLGASILFDPVLVRHVSQDLMSDRYHQGFHNGHCPSGTSRSNARSRMYLSAKSWLQADHVVEDC